MYLECIRNLSATNIAKISTLLTLENQKNTTDESNLPRNGETAKARNIRYRSHKTDITKNPRIVIGG